MTEAKRAMTNELDVQEMSFVDLAYQWLAEMKEPQKLHDLLAHVARVQGVSPERMQERIAILYTDLNMDGRFTCVGESLWGLKHWYPFESTEDDILSLELAEEEEYQEYPEEDEEERLLDDEDPDSHLDDLDHEADLDLDEDQDLPLDDDLEEEEEY